MKTYFSLFLVVSWIVLFLHSLSSVAQTCNGNLGTNMIANGDFGSGLTPIQQIPVLQSPGYAYNSNPPLGNDEYLISNTTSVLGSDFISIGDNSTDPNGYMFCMNGDYGNKVIFEASIPDLCDDVSYYFSFDVINLRPSNYPYAVPDINVQINGNLVYNTGIIQNDEQWQTHTLSFSPSASQNPTIISLRNNTDDSDGNNFALDNISLRACGPSVQITPEVVNNLCEDEYDPVQLTAIVESGVFPSFVIQWQRSTDGGITWNDIAGANGLTHTHESLSGGNYMYRFLLAQNQSSLSNPNCRVTSHTRSINVIPRFYEIRDSICEGLFVSFGGEEVGTEGTYIDSLVSVDGCDSIVTLELVTVSNQLSALVHFENPTCYGYGDGTININPTPSEMGPFEFTLNGNDINISGMFDGLTEGNYSIKTEDRFGCTFASDIELFNPEDFSISIGPDTLVELGQSFPISIDNNYPIAQFSWSDEVDCERNCLTPIWFPPESGWLVLEAVNENQCVSMDSLYVEVEKVRYLFFPNAFTPNGDGLNDRFYPIGSYPNAYHADSFKIFNRWGQLIHDTSFSMEDANFSGWDGSLKGAPVEAGVYAYKVHVQFLDGVVQDYSGTATLIR